MLFGTWLPLKYRIWRGIPERVKPWDQWIHL